MSSSTLRPCIAGPELRDLVNGKGATFMGAITLSHHFALDDIAWIAQNSRMEYLVPFLVLHHDRSTNQFWPGLPEEARSALPALIETHAEYVLLLPSLNLIAWFVKIFSCDSQGMGICVL